MKPALLEPDALATALLSLPGWEQCGESISKRFDFARYTDGISFVVRVALDAEAADHHPDLHVGWRKVTATLSTHSVGGVTELDIKMARQMETRRATLS